MPHAPAPPSPRRRSRFAALGAAVVVAFLLAGGLALFGGDDSATSPRPVTVTMSGETLTVAANRIRFADQRRGGELPRLDLAMLWPGLDGRTAATAARFTDPASDGAVIQIAIEPRDLDLDSAERLANVYVRFLAPETAGAGLPAVDGLAARRFAPGSPYEDETLYFEPGSVHPFVARCFPRAAGDTRRLCLTELKLGRRLIAAVRFRPALLAEWQTLGGQLRTVLDGLTR